MTRFEFKAFLLFVLLCPLAAVSQTIEPPKVAGQNDVKPQPASFPVGQAEDEQYRIGFQDTLDIQIYRHPQLAQRVSVSSNGTIKLFAVTDPIIAVCKTVAELSKDVEDAYRKNILKNPEAKVVAVGQNSQPFAVVGAVEKPGSFFVNRKVRLLELLAQAGGPSKEAGTRLVVARLGNTSHCKAVPENVDPTKIALFDFKIRDVQEAKQDLVMQPGDIVSVLKADVVFVYGNVNEQGQVPLLQPLTLTQAIASARGLKPATRRDRVRIIRQKPGSLEREETVHDLNAIDKQKAPDPYLEPSDIVAVSEDKTISILNSIKNSLTQGLPSVFYRVP